MSEQRSRKLLIARLPRKRDNCKKIRRTGLPNPERRKLLAEAAAARWRHHRPIRQLLCAFCKPASAELPAERSERTPERTPSPATRRLPRRIPEERWGRGAYYGGDLERNV